MATKKVVRKSKNANSIAQNPLFKALNGNAAPKKVSSKTLSASKSTKNAKSIKKNELAVRLGLVKGASKKARGPAKKINPLAAALSNKPRIKNKSVEAKKESTKPNKIARVKGSKKEEEINFKKLQKRMPAVKHQNSIPSARFPLSEDNLVSRTSNQADYALPYGIGSKIPKQNYAHKAYHAIEQEKFPQNNNRQRRTRSRDTDISFRNASLIPFLRITNLEPDVTETDIRSVLTEKLGPTLKILKRTVLYDNQPAVCAEVFFLKEEYLHQYAAALNNIHADGRLLKAEVSTKSDIIHSDKLWEGMLREVRFLKQEALAK